MIWLERYAKRGFKLFPVERKGKRPLIRNNLMRASSDIEQIRAWAAQFPGCNWGLSLAQSGLVCVDVDREGLGVWKGLTETNGDPETLLQASGSGYGWHYIFKAAEGVKYKSAIASPQGPVKGIDVKHNGYILLEPSIHPKGGLYRWAGNGYDAKIVSPPDWANRLIVKPEPKKREPRPFTSANVKQYHELILRMREKPLTYMQWVTCGQALHAESNGSDEGLELWLELTRGVSFQEGDEERAADKWAGFHEDGGRAIGSLYHVAKELGVAIPNPLLALDKVEFARSARERARAEKEAGWFSDSRNRVVTLDEQKCVEYINNAGYCVIGEGTIYRTYREDGVLKVNPLTNAQFDTATDPIVLKQYDENGGEHLIKARDIWRESTKRRQFSRICFRPKAAPDELNLWTPIPTKPRPGRIDDILTLIRDLACQGEEDRTEYLLDWMAHLVQKPHEKCPIVLVLIGNQGTGKGLITDGLLSGMLGPLYLRIDQPSMLMQQFNMVQARRFCTVLDEACWRGHHNLSNLLKSLTGSTTMLVEEKFGPQYPIENFSRYVVTSNSKEAVKVEVSNRRHFICEMAKPAKPEFYRALWDRVNNGQACPAFLDFLMSRSLQRFSAYDFPTHLDTQGGDTKLASMSFVAQFWAELLLEEPQRLWERRPYDKRMVICLNRRKAFEAFLEWCGGRNNRRATSVMQFWRESRFHASILGHTVQLKYQNRPTVVVCTPTELREAFCAKNRLPPPPRPFPDSEYLEIESISAEDF